MQPSKQLRIAILGDFDRRKHSHWATEAALFHAAAQLDCLLTPEWLVTPSLEARGSERLVEFDGVWGAPGSPYQSMAGMLQAIRFAREQDLIFLGTCGGFQHALIEFTRNVLGIPDADSAEHGSAGEHAVITLVSCPMPDRHPGCPLLDGSDVAVPVAGSQFAGLCGSADLRGEYFCSFETNRAFEPRWRAAGLCAAARGADGELRAFELAAHRFFIGTLFQPQLSSSFAAPHPLISGFLRACLDSRQRR